MQISTQPTTAVQAITLKTANKIEKVSNFTHPIVKLSLQFLQNLRNWIENIPVKNIYWAKVVEQLVPAQCPFERDVKLFDQVLFHIPPLCKLNPIYDQLISLRFRALCYLADLGES